MLTLMSTAYLNQPATRTFRVMLIDKGDEYWVCKESAVSPRARWDSEYFPKDEDDLHTALDRAVSAFADMAYHKIEQTVNCADRLEKGYEPFIEADGYNSTRVYRWNL